MDLKKQEFSTQQQSARAYVLAEALEKMNNNIIFSPVLNTTKVKVSICQVYLYKHIRYGL